jgi:hypothetical protein
VLGVVDKALERKPSKPSGGRKPAPQQVPAAAGSKQARAPTGAAAVIKPSGRFERETTKAELQAVGLQADIDLYYRGSQAAAAAPGAVPGGAKPPQAQQAAAAKPAPGSASKAAAADGAGEAAAEKLPIIIVPKGARRCCACMCARWTRLPRLTLGHLLRAACTQCSESHACGAVESMGTSAAPCPAPCLLQPSNHLHQQRVCIPCAGPARSASPTPLPLRCLPARSRHRHHGYDQRPYLL